MSDSRDRDPSPVEDYLDELLLVLTGDPRQIRHQLSEVEAHLWDATQEGLAAGLDQTDAERAAVARFGSARSLAEAERKRQSVPLRVLTRQGGLSALWLGGVGAIAVGVSGVIAAALGGMWGVRFLVSNPTAGELTPSACARWLHGSHAVTCAQAARADWSFEVVGYRIVLGVLGVVALVAWAVLRRGVVRRGHAAALPSVVVDAVAVTAFGVAGVWLAGQGIDTLVVSSGRGAGQWLSAAPVALAVAIVFAWHLTADLRRPAAGENLTARSS